MSRHVQRGLRVLFVALCVCTAVLLIPALVHGRGWAPLGVSFAALALITTLWVAVDALAMVHRDRANRGGDPAHLRAGPPDTTEQEASDV